MELTVGSLQVRARLECAPQLVEAFRRELCLLLSCLVAVGRVVHQRLEIVVASRPPPCFDLFDLAPTEAAELDFPIA
jgi:hypothetical protein